MMRDGLPTPDPQDLPSAVGSAQRYDPAMIEGRDYEKEDLWFIQLRTAERLDPASEINDKERRRRAIITWLIFALFMMGSLAMITMGIVMKDMVRLYILVCSRLDELRG